ncbi:DUF1624 domain-containing protein [Zunongwangia sp.]|uniref:DUF1624 domain-containing protein n=1 Tax=Zunongwangia sp. TaxID=1965325 RepID=UPI003AA9131A
MSLKKNMATKRILSIDILRGLVIVLMLVDHVRERFFYHHPITDPLDLDNTETQLFFTRLTAHFCAPIFVFLTGLSACLYQNPPNKPKRNVRSFLLKRGLFLVLLEVTLINFSWFGNYKTLYLQVIWAIGISMISLSAMVKINRYIIAGLGLLIVFGHNLLTDIHVNPDNFFYYIWTILHDRGYLLQTDWLSIKASYPVLPWIGVILLGYFSGAIYGKSVAPKTRYKYLLGTSCSLLVLLLILRGFNIYGETLDWQNYDSPLKSIMSFLNYTKYPPSLDFLLFTLGIGSILLFVFERFEKKWMLVLKTFGSVPMFFYVVHLYILLASYKILVLFFGTNKGDYFGVDNVATIWLIAITLACLLYWPTKLFGNYKRASNAKWIKYF